MTMDNRSRDPRGWRGNSTWIMVLVAILAVATVVYMFGLWGNGADMARDTSLDSPAQTDRTPIAPDAGPSATTGSTRIDPAPSTSAPAVQ